MSISLIYVASLTDCNTGHTFNVVSNADETIESFTEYLLKKYGNFCNWNGFAERSINATKTKLSLTKGATMKHSNIDKQAMALAGLLLKADNVMTTKVKGFNYFLNIAYKMLKNEAHFDHVLLGLEDVKLAMFYDDRVTEQRYGKFLDGYLAISKISYN